MVAPLRAIWNGVTGHVVGAPDAGGSKDETLQRVKHLALAAILKHDETGPSSNGSLADSGTATGSRTPDMA